MSRRKFREIPNKSAGHYLQITLAGAASGVGASTRCSGESFALQVLQNGVGGTRKCTPGNVGDAGATNGGLTGARGTVRGKESTLEGGFLENSLDIREIVTLRKNVATSANLDTVAAAFASRAAASVLVVDAAFTLSTGTATLRRGN